MSDDQIIRIGITMYFTAFAFYSALLYYITL